MKPLLTIAQVCETLQLSENTVRKLIADGNLPSMKVARSVRIAEEDLITYLASCRTARPGENAPPVRMVRLRHL